MKLWKPNFNRRITGSFLILALLTVSIVSSVAFLRAREALKQAAYDRLTVTATLKEQQITQWLETCEQDFLMISQFPDVKRLLKQLLEQKPNTTTYKSAYNSLNTYFENVRYLKPKYSEILVLDRSNQIILSTDKSKEKQYEMPANLTYFEEVVAGEDFALVFFVSPETGKPALTYAAPIRDSNGRRTGLILAELDLKRIDQIVRERAGLGKTGETYIVGSLAEKPTFISREESVSDSLPEVPRSWGIDKAMQGLSGEQLYQNYAGVPVIGTYRWLNQQDMALLVEMAQSEAFLPARRLAGTIVIVSLGAAALLFLGVARLAKQLSLSRSQLENYSRRLEQKAQEAHAANRAKSEFLANMSHELRTPLNAILGFTQLMARDPNLEASQLNRLGIISRSGEHLLALINDVLSMSKIEAGRTTLNESHFDLHQFLSSLEEMLQVKAKDAGLQLIVERDLDVPQYIEADEGKLRQVLLNLMGNAIKFTDTGKVVLSVTIKPQTTALDDGQVPIPGNTFLYFKVTDTGSGIATEELANLFDPFYQASKNRQAHQGTGLGLAISQQFVELMGGELQVESEVGVGSVFAFSILVRPSLALAIPEIKIGKRVVSLAPDQPTYRILVVEDADDSRCLLVDLLKMVGFTIREACDGEAALHHWRTWQPHLIWMDMRMPKMDGYEATRRIRAAAAAVPKPIIIALTASAFEEERTAVLVSGCDDFVRKPFKEQIIFDKMQQYLGVQYCYDQAFPPEQFKQEDNNIAHPHTTQRWLILQGLQQMPSHWTHHLHRAAVQVDADRVKQLVSQMPSQYALTAEQLLVLIENFDFETLIELTEALL